MLARGVGDEALRMLATTLLADIRAEDVACRYGGEEFVVVMPGASRRSGKRRFVYPAKFDEKITDR